MSKKKRSVYKVELCEVVGWNEETDFPDAGTIATIDGVDPSFATASISEAYSYYLKLEEEELIDNGFYDLRAIEIYVTDGEWVELLKKGKLEYADYAQYLTKSVDRSIVWSYSCDKGSDGLDCALEELLMVQSENFNMEIVCAKAEISYTDYLDFQNNKRPFSSEKKYELLTCMSEIGKESWNDYLESRY